MEKCCNDKMELKPGDRGFVRRTMKEPGTERKPPSEHYHNGHNRQFISRAEGKS